VQASVNRLMLIGLVSLFLAVIFFVGFFIPPLAMAQQQQQTTTRATTTTTPPSSSLSITTIPPLTPEEQEQQNRLQSVIVAITRDLNETEKQVSGIVFTPRWSEPVWINANSLAVIIAYCLPGEFADSGQEILGGFELEVLESYSVALPQGFMAWMMVIGNEDRQDRLPAALGVICASDLNDVETRVLSPQEQQQINNVVQQFTTQVTNIEQVINIINNVTRNGTTPTGPVTPPPTNDTGVVPDTIPPVFTGTKPASGTHTLLKYPEDPNAVTRYIYGILAEDNVDGRALYQGNDNVIQEDDVGGVISIECNPDSGSLIPLGSTTFECTAVDEAGNVGTYSWTYTILPPQEGVLPPPETGQEGQPPGALLPGIVPGEEQPQVPPPTVPGEEEGEPTTGGGEEEQGGTPPPSSTTEEQEEVPSPDDDTGGEG
jgi:hypothetical protein